MGTYKGQKYKKRPKKKYKLYFCPHCNYEIGVGVFRQNNFFLLEEIELCPNCKNRIKEGTKWERRAEETGI